MSKPADSMLKIAVWPRGAKELEPSVTAIQSWVSQADLDDGHRKDGLTTYERRNVWDVTRELCRVKPEQDLLAIATIGSRGSRR